MSTGGLEDFDPNRLQILRDRAGITRKQVAVRAGVVVGTARGWENGRNSPSEAKAVAIADLLGVHPAELTNTPRNQATLRQLRQWRGWRAVDAAEHAGIPAASIYTAETYVSSVPDYVREALATAYEVSEKQIDAAWERGRKREFGDIIP